MKMCISEPIHFLSDLSRKNIVNVHRSYIINTVYAFYIGLLRLKLCNFGYENYMLLYF